MRGDPYVVVSGDTHAGPSLTSLRVYCPRRHLDDFDDFEERVAESSRRRGFAAGTMNTALPSARQAVARNIACAGHDDPDARLRDMDDEGIAAEVVFAGGQNGRLMPFVGTGLDAGSHDGALRHVGFEIWNRWLADFVAGAPARHVGVMQVPLWDVDLAVRFVRAGHELGLRAVNFPAPRPDMPPYIAPEYEPFWSVCEELALPLLTHSASGETSRFDGPGGASIAMAETHWLSRRALPQLIFGGIFERHSDLKLVFVEQRVLWIPETLRELDSIYSTDITGELDEGSGEIVPISSMLPSRPSEYFRRNCFVTGSFMARFEVALRHEVGISQLLWGSDYPHAEGTWPHTKLSLRHTFHDVPEPDTRAILGGNAIEVFGLDEAELTRIAAQIGPTPDEVATPVRPEELPRDRGYAFRETGAFS